MCGIAGFFDTRDLRSLPELHLGAMTDALAHRGPDGRELFRAPGVGLGHRRLAIIDLEGGRQPMATPDGQIVTVFNGEIYNYKDVRRELVDLGYRFATNSDTEVLLHGWLAWGEALLHRLRGMFAFAIYDQRRSALFLARDRLGVKPLHYALLPDGCLIFASELKGLLAHPRLARRIDPSAVEDFFAYGYVPDHKCLLAGVSKLPAGHSLLLERGREPGTPRRYWDLDFTPRHNGRPDDLAAELVERMREAVKLRMMADVPLGAFLSGGVDSSAIVALMSGLSPVPVNTCTIGFDVASYDETANAELLARRYATCHRHRTVTVDDFSLVDRLTDAYDEPFADASALPTLRLCELARQTVKVALSGDGADELFAGYRRYRMHAYEDRFRSLMPPAVRRGLFGPLGRFYPKLDWAPRGVRAKSTLEALGHSAPEAYFNSAAALPDRVRQHLFSPGFRRSLQGYWAGSIYVDTMRNAPAEDALSRAQYADVKHWLPGDILTKMDRASMAVGLEAREPLLDHQLIEWAAGLPAATRIRGGRTKWLLKRAMEPYVPKELLYRPKMGFSVPISTWFRGPLADRAQALVSSSALVETGWFDRDFLAKVCADHRAGRFEHGRLLWQLMMFDQSLRRLTDQPVRVAA